MLSLMMSSLIFFCFKKAFHVEMKECIVKSCIFLFFSVWEIKFHQSNPEHLFTCSDDGSVWHWDATQVNTASMVTNHPMTGTGKY
jgi:hypothetical protein